MSYYNAKNLSIALLLSVGYIALGTLSIKFITMPSGIAIAWLPNSLLLAFFLIKNKEEWKYYIPFFVASEIIADYPTFSLLQALQFSFINLFETMIAAFVIKKISQNSNANFSDTKYVLAFFFIAANIMPMISGILGATVYYTQIGTETTFFDFWRIWYFGDAVGILILTPLMVILKENYIYLKNYKFNLQSIVMFILTLFLAVNIFSIQDINIALPTTPLIFILILLWIVYKQGILPGLLCSALITGIAIYYTVDGVGPFYIFEDKQTTIYLQEFVASLFIITLFFGVLHKELKELNKTLEQKVEEKTKSLQDANQKLTELATKDSLTKIYNRRMIDEYISKEIDKSKRYKYDLSVIMIDIDNFKEVNDIYGHHFGDEVILKVVEIISKNIRKTDIFGRWGGEEFIVILPSTNLDNACKLAQNLREKIASYRFEQIGYKTISLGLVQYDFQEDRITFIKKEDNALYEAKKNGRNRVVCKS